MNTFGFCFFSKQMDFFVCFKNDFQTQSEKHKNVMQTQTTNKSTRTNDCEFKPRRSWKLCDDCRHF